MVLRTAYEQAADRAVNWLAARLEDNGSYGDGIDDLACYYKSPYLFGLSGRPREAARVLAFIASRFMRADGDFVTSGSHKSNNVAFDEYWAYPNGWIAIGAQRQGRFDVAYPAWRYLREFQRPGDGGFRTSRAPEPGVAADALTTAHLGLLALYVGELTRAEQAGHWLAGLLDVQSDLAVELLLRRDDSGTLVSDFPAQAAVFHTVRRCEAGQAYFMVGYPIGFLVKLFEATRRAEHLDAARRYLDFALSCEGDLRASPQSHKVAWGAALVARHDDRPHYRALATDIAEHLLGIQDPEGAWLAGEPAHTTFDQTAEIAIWLQQISAAISV